MPPSTTKLAPVTKPDRSRSSRKATISAMSCGFSDAAGGMLGVVLAAQLGVFAGGDPARADAIDPHVGTEADGERVGQRQQPALGGGIGFGVRLRHQRAGRGDGDDRALGGAQRLLGGAREQECRGQVDVEDPAPVLERQAADRLRIMMPALETTASSRPNRSSVRPHRVARRRSSATSPSMVTDDRAESRITAHQPRLRQIERRDAPAGVEQMVRDRAADAVRGPGDERDRPVRLCRRRASRAIDQSFVATGRSGARAPFGP